MNLEEIQQKRVELLNEIKAIPVDSNNPNLTMLHINKCALQREVLMHMAYTAEMINDKQEK